LKTAWRYKRRTNRVCIFKIIFKLFCRKIQTRLLVAIAFVSYIQTRLPLITAFESLLLGHKNSFPLACPMFLRFPLLLLLLPPFAAVVVVGLLPSVSVHCLPLPLPRNASPPSSPFDQPLSRLSLSPRFCFFGHHYHVEVLSQPPPPPLKPPPPRLSLWHFLLLPPRRPLPQDL